MKVADTTEKDCDEQHYKEEMLKAEIADDLYEQTRNAIMKSWDNAVLGLTLNRRSLVDAMFVKLLNNIDDIFKH